jgi:hypothetical protein
MNQPPEPLTIEQTLKLALDAISAGDDFLFNYHDCEPNNERELALYASIRKRNMQAFEAAREALAQNLATKKCIPHPKAPHGFDRNASHGADRYVCECESWDPYDAGYQSGFEAGIDAPCPICSERAEQSEAPKGWKLVGYWHQAEDPDECDFFLADAINGDCPDCHPCYIPVDDQAVQGTSATKSQEALKLALEALEILGWQPTEEAMDYRDNAIEAIRKALAEQKLAEPCPCGKQTMAWCFANTCSKAEQPAKQPKLSDYEPDGMHHNKPHKCKYPKCSYPCLDLPDCRDAEQPAILLGEVRGLQWDKTSQAFNDWWDSDYDPTGNPFRQDSAAYWAWAGWKAAIEQAEQAQPYADKAAMFAHMKDRIRIDPVTGNVGIGTPQQPEQEQPRISAGPITPAMQAGPTEAQKQQLAAFAKSMQAQPVAVFDENLGRPKMFADAPMLKHGQTLYTAPPPRQPWQGLTDEEFQWIYDNGRTPAGMIELAEAKLKEKNT